MAERTSGLRGRGMRLALAGVVSAAVAVGGVAVAGAAPASAPAAPARVAVAVAPAAAPAAAPVAAGGVTTLALPKGQYDVYYNLKPTARYPQTVFSEVTNEGKFKRIFPISGAKNNLGQVGTVHPLKAGKVLNAPVTVSVLGSTTWRFKTNKGHFDGPGTVQFWLYKKGDMMKLHVRGICALCGIPHYKAIAYAQWIQFAAKIKMNVRL